MRLLLASTSRYRQALLGRLQIPFVALPPEVDETPVAGEAPDALALRLARAKADALRTLHPQATVIGSDQVAELDGQPVGKPGNAEAALAQLSRSSGREVVFHTALHVAWPGDSASHLDRTAVHFRVLDGQEIRRYLDAERPFDCAGSFKCEGLGIALFERLVSEDPTALVGLPLIATAAALRKAGFRVP